MQRIKLGFSKLLIGLTIVITAEAACKRHPIRKEGNETNELIGVWEKVKPLKCSQMYPDVIEFSANGVYQTQTEVTSVEMAWDAGTYEVDRQLVKISNAKEISKSYRFVIKNEMVTFEDDQGCVFPYRRM